MPSASVQADAVFDDDVIQVRCHPQQHLTDDVHHPEMFGVNRGGAPRARSKKQRAIVLADDMMNFLCGVISMCSKAADRVRCERRGCRLDFLVRYARE